jgi:DNA-directed RNA polymerase subunit RPC12/RpoP
MATSMEIRCTACGQVALVRAEPVYDGFRKTGESLVCTACGHRYASRETTPFLAADHRPRVFTDRDKPDPTRVFRDDERRRCCGWCAHFVINPFNQRCGLTNRDMQATDLCIRFTPKPDEAPTPPPAKPASPLDALFGKGPT